MRPRSLRAGWVEHWLRTFRILNNNRVSGIAHWILVMEKSGNSLKGQHTGKHPPLTLIFQTKPESGHFVQHISSCHDLVVIVLRDERSTKRAVPITVVPFSDVNHRNFLVPTLIHLDITAIKSPSHIKAMGTNNNNLNTPTRPEIAPHSALPAHCRHCVSSLPGTMPALYRQMISDLARTDLRHSQNILDTEGSGRLGAVRSNTRYLHVVHVLWTEDVWHRSLKTDGQFFTLNMIWYMLEIRQGNFQIEVAFPQWSIISLRCGLVLRFVINTGLFYQYHLGPMGKVDTILRRCWTWTNYVILSQWLNFQTSDSMGIVHVLACKCVKILNYWFVITLWWHDLICLCIVAIRKWPKFRFRPG